MSKTGERWWRLHVERQTLTPEQDNGSEGARREVEQDKLWDGMAESDKEEVRERLRIAKGD